MQACWPNHWMICAIQHDLVHFTGSSGVVRAKFGVDIRAFLEVKGKSFQETGEAWSFHPWNVYCAVYNFNFTVVHISYVLCPCFFSSDLIYSVEVDVYVLLPAFLLCSLPIGQNNTAVEVRAPGDYLKYQIFPSRTLEAQRFTHIQVSWLRFIIHIPSIILKIHCVLAFPFFSKSLQVFKHLLAQTITLKACDLCKISNNS